MIAKEYIIAVGNINKRNEGLNLALLKVCSKAVRFLYSNAGKTASLPNGCVEFIASEPAEYILNNIGTNLRQHVASWFRKMGLDVSRMDAKVALSNGVYIVGNLPNAPKKQEDVFKRMAFAEAVASGEVERPADFADDILPLTPRTYTEKAEKVLSAEAAEVEKRANAAIAALLKRLGNSDPAAKAVVNAKWARPEPEAMSFIDGAGHLFTLTDDECNAIVSLVQHMRAETQERPARESLAA